ncbi:endocuticle structural glycoprotein SgAbd-2-like [Cherax quadricarinatus]|uniref:endocuticle structural glycoprotein SgAbd-2-like n=1 Tax=Cherax quadricarinatus TaxID=27406 RepID=UPI00387ED11C
MIVRTLVLFAVVVGATARPQSYPSPGSAPAGFGAAQSQFRPFRPQGSPPPGSAPGGFGAGQSQRPFKPRPPVGPPAGSAPGGFGAAQSQFPFGPQADSPITRPRPPPTPPGYEIPILVDEREGPHPDGSYSFKYETGDGISRYEQGTPQGETGAVAMQGGWSFTFPDGTPAVFTFVADELGYRVESSLIPTPHPLPAHAIAQIEFARQQKAQGGAPGAKRYGS